MPAVSTTVEGVNDTVGLAMSTARFNTVVPTPVLLLSVTVYATEEEATVGVPVMAHALLMLRPEGRAGEMRQPDTVPVVAAVWVAAVPMVSITVEGVNDTVGFAISTDSVSVVPPVPVLLESVMV